MKIIEVEQGSPEWLLLRREKIGASEIAAVCGKSPYMKPWDLWEHKIMGNETPMNEHMQRGKEVEKWVATFYPHCKNPTALHDTHEWMLASFDLFDDNTNTIYEIKCVGADKIKEIRSGKIPIHWKYQMNQQMMVAQKDECILLVCEAVGADPYRIVYERHPLICDEIIDKGSIFDDHLKKGIAIQKPVIDEDITIFDDCEELWMLQQQISNLSDQANRIKDRLKEKARDNSLTCGEYTFRRSVRKGTVNYAEVPQLAGVDLDPYRRAETVSFTLIRE